MADPVPLERDEQIRFVTWLEDRGIRSNTIALTRGCNIIETYDSPSKTLE